MLCNLIICLWIYSSVYLLYIKNILRLEQGALMKKEAQVCSVTVASHIDAP